MEKMIQYLQNNKLEAVAILEGRAMPVERLNPKELLQLIREINTKKDASPMGYWG
ncbi:hypothetical protein D3C84_295790 [compost metagenome]